MNEYFQKYKIYIYGVIAVIVIFIIGYVLGFRSGERVSYNRNGANSVTKQLDTIGDNQHKLTKDLGNAAAEAGQIGEGISSSQRGITDVQQGVAKVRGDVEAEEYRVGELQTEVTSVAEDDRRVTEDLTESGKIIRESQEILAKVRSRGPQRSGN